MTKCGTIGVDALWIQSDQTIKRSKHQGLFTRSISLHCYLFSHWMCVPPHCIKHSTFQNVWRPHHAQPAEYLQIAFYHYFLSYSHLMPVMSRFNLVLKLLFVTLFDIVFSCSTVHELPSGLPLSCVLQKPRVDLADTYISFVRQNQDILRHGVSDELYIETVFDVSASTVSSLHEIMFIFLLYCYT